MKTKKEHLYLGRLYSVKGEYKKAIKEYKKALEIDPNYKPARINLKFIYCMKGPLNKDRCASNKYMRLQKKTERSNKDVK